MQKWADLPVRWGKIENLHITLAYLGFIEDENLPGICRSVRNAAREIEPFEVRLSEILIAPSESQPRMIWAAGEKSTELKTLVEAVEKSLGMHKQEKKSFAPHATLARIRKEKWMALPVKPEIQEKINFIIPVSELVIYESLMLEGKRKYLLIENCLLR